MVWYDCKTNPPEEGWKVLCEFNNDYYVAMRFGDFYHPLPKTDEHMETYLCQPNYWQPIEFKEGVTGHMFFKVEDDKRLYKLSELKKHYPKDYEALIEVMNG